MAEQHCERCEAVRPLAAGLCERCELILLGHSCVFTEEFECVSCCRDADQADAAYVASQSSAWAEDVAPIFDTET